MKKLAGLSAVAILALAGCGSSAVSYKGETAPDEKGDVTTVTYDKSGDDITNVKFDVLQGEKDGASKRADSEAGTYGMKEATGKSWIEHIEGVETYVNENDKMPELNDEGLDADGSTGATIHLNGFKEAFDNAKEVE